MAVRRAGQRSSAGMASSRAHCAMDRPSRAGQARASSSRAPQPLMFRLCRRSPASSSLRRELHPVHTHNPAYCVAGQPMTIASKDGSAIARLLSTALGTLT